MVGYHTIFCRPRHPAKDVTSPADPGHATVLFRDADRTPGHSNGRRDEPSSDIDGNRHRRSPYSRTTESLNPPWSIRFLETVVKLWTRSRFRHCFSNSRSDESFPSLRQIGKIAVPHQFHCNAQVWSLQHLLRLSPVLRPLHSQICTSRATTTLSVAHIAGSREI